MSSFMRVKRLIINAQLGGLGGRCGERVMPQDSRARVGSPGHICGRPGHAFVIDEHEVAMPLCKVHTKVQLRWHSITGHYAHNWPADLAARYTLEGVLAWATGPLGPGLTKAAVRRIWKGTL